MRYFIILALLVLAGCGGSGKKNLETEQVLLVNVNEEGRFKYQIDHMKIIDEMYKCSGIKIRLPIDIYTYDENIDPKQNKGSHVVIYLDKGTPYYAEIILIGAHASRSDVFRHEIGHIVDNIDGYHGNNHDSRIFKECVSSKKSFGFT